MCIRDRAYLRGLAVDNCGCFGLYLSQRLSWFVLLQDALLLVYAALMIRSARRAGDSMNRLSRDEKEALA